MYNMALKRSLAVLKKVSESATLNVCRTYNKDSQVKLFSNCYRPFLLQTAELRTNSWKHITRQETVVREQDTCKEDIQATHNVITKVNDQLENKTYSRLFAVVHICGKQFKVTDEDIIIIEGYWPPEIGDKLKLDKVLLAGSSDFTLIGRPILSRDLVCVTATVIEKTLSHIKTHFRKKRRKQYMRINFHRSPYTMLRINSIEFKGQINDNKEDEGLDGRIF